MTNTHTQRRVRAQIRRRRINATRRTKQARGQRKRAERKALRDYRWRLTQITDPIEIVMRVLMARGLPTEVARYIIFTHGALQTPSASFLTDPRLQAFHKKFIDPNWRTPVHPHIRLICACPTVRIEDMGRIPRGNCLLLSPVINRAHQWCKDHRQSIEVCTGNPIAPKIVAHTATGYAWRGDRLWRGSLVEENQKPRHDIWLARNLGDWWSLQHPTLCATTNLYYTLFANIHQLPPLATPDFYNREFSLANYFQNASTQDLHLQLIDAYPAPRGRHIAERIGHDRKRIIRYILKS